MQRLLTGWELWKTHSSRNFEKERDRGSLNSLRACSRMSVEWLQRQKSASLYTSGWGVSRTDQSEACILPGWLSEDDLVNQFWLTITQNYSLHKHETYTSMLSINLLLVIKFSWKMHKYFVPCRRPPGLTHFSWSAAHGVLLPWKKTPGNYILVPQSCYTNITYTYR